MSEVNTVSGAESLDSNNNSSKAKSEKSQVWVRIRPMAKYEKSFLAVGEDNKTLRMTDEQQSVGSSPRYPNSGRSLKKEVVTFKSDGILRNASQEETYDSVVRDVVDKAVMNGKSGVVVCLGPENAGKSYTLFGRSGKYHYRGVVSRALEQIFNIKNSRNDEIAYSVRMALVEVHRNKIRDLLTTEADRQFDSANCAQQTNYYNFKPVDSIENGFLNLMLGLAGQKNTVGRESEDQSHYHTICNIEITGQSMVPSEDSTSFHAMITFAKIASIPKRSNELVSTVGPQQQQVRGVADFGGYSPRTCSLSRKGSQFVSPRRTFSCSSRAGRGNQVTPSPLSSPSSPVSEAIQIRKDLFLLEQLFERAKDIKKQYASSPKGWKPVNLSQYFRQCKLAFCLRDIISFNTEVRIILNIRPEISFYSRTMEAIKFVRKVEVVSTQDMGIHTSSSTLESPQLNPEDVRQELALIHQELSTLKSTLTSTTESEESFLESPRPVISDLITTSDLVNPVRRILLETAAFLDGKIDSVEIGNKAQVKLMLETIRSMWQFEQDAGWKFGQVPTVTTTKSEVHQMTQAPEEKPPRKKRGSKSSKGSTSTESISSKEGSRKKRLRKLSLIQNDHGSSGGEGTTNTRKHSNGSISFTDDELQTTHLVQNFDIDEDETLEDRLADDSWNLFADPSSPESRQLSNSTAVQEQCLEEFQQGLKPTTGVLVNMIHKIYALLHQDFEKINKVPAEPSNEKGAEGHNSDATAVTATPPQLTPIQELSYLDTNCEEFLDGVLSICTSALEQHGHLIEKFKEEIAKGISLEIDFQTEENASTVGTIDTAVSEQPPETTVTFQRDSAASSGGYQNYIAERYEVLSKAANKHAKQMLKDTLRRRPSWVSSFSKITNC